MLKKVQIFKALDIEIKKQKGPAAVKDGYRGHHSLKEELSQPGITIIAEVSGGNPLRGQVRDSFRASTHAKSLLENGAKAISVATDRFLYAGDDKQLSDARSVVKAPILRRDFIFEEYQIEESKILGADAVYLMAALLTVERMQALQKLAVAKGLDVVAEVATEEDLAKALEAGAEIICVVGRDLDTWVPSFELGLALLEKVPEKKCLRMFEAGVNTLQQIKKLETIGVHGVIIGDALLDEFYPGKRLAQILAGIEPPKKTAKAKTKPEAAPPKVKEPAAPASTTTAKPKPGSSSQAKSAKSSSTTTSSSHPAHKGKKEFPMEHILPDEPIIPVEGVMAEPAKKVAKKAAKKPAAKKAVKKAAPKKAAKKPAAKKPAVKKAAAKKPAVKKAVKKAAPKKVAKKVVKKAAPKKVAKKVVKKATPKKVVKKAVKKVAPKKVVKKVAPKKAVKKVVKKAAPKKAAPKKVVKKAVKKAAPKKAVKK